MLLKNLIKSCSSEIGNIRFSGLCSDSRKIKKGDVFFALKGKRNNGEKYIKDAIKKKVAAVIVNEDYVIKNDQIPIIKTQNINEFLLKSCKKFFKDKPKNIIAVTGTNGKSSVADFFYQILSQSKIPVASIGTLGIKLNGKFKKISHTTPDLIELHKHLNYLKKKNINNVIIEASSHGLHQGRLDGLEFKFGIFTNFSQDHLDYHKSMKNYFKAKMLLFSKIRKKKGFIICDNKMNNFSKLQKEAKKNNLKILTIKKIINKGFIKKKGSSNIFGEFQKKNLSMAILAAYSCGVKKTYLENNLKNLKNLNGRLELIKNLSNEGKVYLDYAHTPDALKNSLLALKRKYNKKINIVFGCGGERDKQKRKLMAKIAKQFCSNLYITDDNPRNESPKEIRKEIIKYLSGTKYYEIGDRKKAIQKSIDNCGPGEIVLIAGKGHETTQDYGKRILAFSDRSVIKNTKNKSFSYKKAQIYLNNELLKQILSLNKNFVFRGVSINSKDIKKNNLFIGLKGKRFDGKNFVAEAIKNGSSLCLISGKKIKKNSKNIIYCKNTHSFLKKLAIKNRYHSNAKIIGITGSAGKTSLKSLLGKLLEIYGNTYFSPKSFNNNIGVPLSLANLEIKHQYGVFEIGMSKQGEIRKLSKIVKPNIGIITNIGAAHIQNFKNLDDIAKTKSEIIENIPQGGDIILNRDDKYFNYLSSKAKKKKLNIYTFGFSKKSNVFPKKIFHKDPKKTIIINAFNKEYKLDTYNINIYNLLCCFVVIKILKLEVQKSKKFFNKIESIRGRGKVFKIKRYNKYFNLIDESYNSNPLSAEEAINKFSKLNTQKNNKYLLISDMLELGKKSEFYHSKLAKIINKTNIDKVFIYGDKIFKTYKNISNDKKGNILQSKQDFDLIFSKIIKKNDYIMIKGSNATGLFNLCKKLIGGKSVI